jgi:hypothetical protein
MDSRELRRVGSGDLLSPMGSFKSRLDMGLVA